MAEAAIQCVRDSFNKVLTENTGLRTQVEGLKKQLNECTTKTVLNTTTPAVLNRIQELETKLQLCKQSQVDKEPIITKQQDDLKVIRNQLAESKRIVDDLKAQLDTASKSDNGEKKSLVCCQSNVDQLKRQLQDISNLALKTVSTQCAAKGGTVFPLKRAAGFSADDLNILYRRIPQFKPSLRTGGSDPARHSVSLRTTYCY
jgi:cell division septum initiation protein DivIVA